MFTLKIQNSAGEVFELTHNLRDYIVSDITGLAYPKFSVNAAQGGTDGAIFGSTFAEMRNIVISVMPRGRVEENRQYLYRMFPPKEPVTIFFQNENRDVKILGYIESLDGGFFTDEETIQISILCPQPYFEAAEDIVAEISHILRYFEFPFDISEPVEFAAMTDDPSAVVTNSGDLPAGVTFNISFTGSVENLIIFTGDTTQFFRINYSFANGDVLKICTLSGSLSADLTRSTDVINMIPYVTENSTWFKLPHGDTAFTFSVSTGSADDVEVEISMTELYGGV